LLSALRTKYERIRALRENRIADPKAEMASLADEFPSALRELDRLPMDVIAARISALEAAESNPACVEGWMIAQHELHRFARGALAVKKWLATTPTASAEEREAAFRKALPTLRDEAALFATQLEEIDAPLRGRVMDVVYTRVAGELGIPERELRALLHERS
jgi:hypothetical protein